jgi:DNA polymerase III delta prime subunit
MNEILYVNEFSAKYNNYLSDSNKGVVAFTEGSLNKKEEKPNKNDTLFIYKFQPIMFTDFEIDQDVITLLRTLINMNNLNILFVGDIGSGKTTLLNALIKEYYCYNPSTNASTSTNECINYSENILHINSLKEQGINFYRNEVKTFCQTCSFVKGKKKIVVLDDVDLINEQSQQVFRNCIDKYSNNVHFISSCSNTQKVIESIQSRLCIIKIKPFCRENLTKIMQKIKIKENIVIEPDAEHFVINICNNTAKILINYMEKFKLINMPITIDLATQVCTNISFFIFIDFTHFVKQHKLNEAITTLYNIYDKGYSVMDILDTYSLFVKTTDILNETEKYIIISYICKYITIFHNIHEEPIEIALFVNNLIQNI